MYGYYHPEFSFLGTFLSIVVWVLIITLVIALVRRLVWHDSMYHGRRWRHMGPGSQNGALDILKERYAKGEINKEEFEQKKKVLS